MNDETVTHFLSLTSGQFRLTEDEVIVQPPSRYHGFCEHDLDQATTRISREDWPRIVAWVAQNRQEAEDEVEEAEADAQEIALFYNTLATRGLPAQLIDRLTSMYAQHWSVDPQTASLEDLARQDAANVAAFYEALPATMSFALRDELTLEYSQLWNGEVAE